MTTTTNPGLDTVVQSMMDSTDRKKKSFPPKKKPAFNSPAEEKAEMLPGGTKDSPKEEAAEMRMNKMLAGGKKNAR